MAKTKNPNAFALEIEGESMEPNHCAGSIAIVEPNYPVRRNTLVVTRFVEDGGVLFKQIIKTGEDGGSVVLHSFNTLYPDVIRPHTDLRFIYPVLEVRADSKVNATNHLAAILSIPNQ